MYTVLCFPVHHYLCITSMLSLIISFTKKIIYSLMLNTCKKPSVHTVTFSTFVWIFPIFDTSEDEVSKSKSSVQDYIVD